MAVTTVLFWVSLVISVIGSNASGELVILHSPESLQFSSTSNQPVESALKEVFSASLGLSVQENSEWDGLAIKDPFKSPEAVVDVVIDGVSSLGAAHLKGVKYQLEVDEYEPDTFEAMKHRIQQRFVGGSNNLVSIKLSNLDELTSHSNVFGDVTIPKLQKQTYEHLKPETEEDLKFLMELAALKGLTDKVKAGAITPDSVIDFYYLHFGSLHFLSDYYGPNSLKVKEAKKLLGEELERLNNAFVKAYYGSVLFTVVTTDVTHSRRARAVSDGQVRSVRSTYSEDYAAIFNILLWFGVVFVFTLIAIVYALIDMDPGRDSIIYRMTSTRMKKDN